MTIRDELRLDAAEMAQFLSDEVGPGAEIVMATAGTDGYPDVLVVDARFVAASGEPGEAGAAAIEVVGEAPPDDVPLCAIVERGETYDDIRAVIVRGTLRDRRVPLGDVVTFAFAKLRS